MNLNIDYSQFQALQDAMKAYAGNTEDVVNEVLHDYGGESISDEIKRLMPVSGRRWNGKPTAAKNANSLKIVPSQLAVTIKSQKKYQYLYFPDDGSNTKRHAGNKRFFLKSAENKTNEIVNRCIQKLVNIP